MALTDSLDELITSGAITPQLAMKVLQQVCTVRQLWSHHVTDGFRELVAAGLFYSVRALCPYIIPFGGH